MSVVYEDVNLDCNHGAGGEKELREIKTFIPTTYVGETSRSIYMGAYERALELL